MIESAKKRLEAKHDLSNRIKEATERLRSYYVRMQYTKQVPINELRQYVLPIVQELANHSDMIELFQELQAVDDYLYRHHVGVAVIATIIGKWMNLSSQEYSLLMISALLHDVGKIKVPWEIINKPGKLTADEFGYVKKHTIFGYELIKNTIGLSHRSALVALQHHEREDGAGYPFGLKGDKIDQLSKIVAVADVFHAMSSNRIYHEALPFYQVINEMQRDRFGRLEPSIVKLLLQKVLDTMVGNEAELNDGRRCKIILLNPSDPFHPLIQIDAEYIDLSKLNDLKITRLLNRGQ